ncbi:hypothetical protein QUR06_000260 [Escherichia coli]|nr:hypothetical protein [Escherichia coli]
MKEFTISKQMLSMIEDSNHWATIDLNGSVESDATEIKFKTWDNEYIKGFFKSGTLESLGL